MEAENKYNRKSDTTNEELTSIYPIFRKRKYYDLKNRGNIGTTTDLDTEKGIEELLDSETVLPLLECVPYISDIQLQNVEEHPFMKFTLKEVRKQEVDVYIKERALTAKVDEFVKNFKKAGWGKKSLVSEQMGMSIVRSELGKESKNALLQDIHKTWIADIRDMLPKYLAVKYSEITEEMLNEVKENYTLTLYFQGLYTLMKPGRKEVRQQLIKPLKPDFSEHLMNLAEFFKNRAYIQKYLFITHPFVRETQNSSHRTIPYTLLDFKLYRSKGHMMPIDVFAFQVTADLKKAEDFLIKNWYFKIMNSLSKNTFKNIPMRLMPRLLTCASVCVSLQMTQLVHRTINSFLEVLSDPVKFPHLSLAITFENNNIILVPDLKDIYGFFQHVIQYISSMLQDLPAMETYFSVPSRRQHLQIKRSESYRVLSENKLWHIILEMFAPVMEHINNLENEFKELWIVFGSEEFKTLCSGHDLFDEWFESLDQLSNYGTKIRELLEYEFFDTGSVCQQELIINLNIFVEKAIHQVVTSIVAAHIKKNTIICEKFELVKKRALTVPQNTEDLLTLGQYMLYCNTTFMAHMKEEILESMKISYKLMAFTDLSKFHIELNVRTAHWLSDIKPVFDENSSMFEATKFDFEDRLRETVQNLNNSLIEYAPTLTILNNIDDTNNIFEYVQYVQKQMRIIESFDQTVVWINSEEALFKNPPSTYPLLVEIKTIFEPFSKMILTCHKWFRKYKVCMDGAFDDLVPEEVESLVDEFYKDVIKTQKFYKAKCKQQATDDYPRRFHGVVDDPDPLQWPSPVKICSQTINHIKDFRQHLQLVSIMCNPALTERHWMEISQLAGFDLTPNAGTTLRKVVNFNLSGLLDQFEIISVGATKELMLQKNLAKMKNEWTNMVLSTSPYKGMEILSAIDEIQTLLDDHLIKTLSMKGSAFVKPIEAEVKEWYALLDRVYKTLEAWGTMQIQYLYFLPIFSAKDIIAQMPEEGVLFHEVDTTYKNIMKQVQLDPRVLETAGAYGLLDTLKKNNEMLDTVNTGVNNYLEQKRLFFPRLFFLSNDEMLEILSETKDPLRVQPHLKKCFEGINKLGFDSELNIFCMFSAENEEVKLITQISTAEARGCVEKWLIQVEEQMLASVKDVIMKSVEAYPKTIRTDWVQEWPGQVVLCVSQIYWTLEVHSELRKKSVAAIQSYHSFLTNQLNDIIQLVRGKLSKQARITLGALVVLDVHSKDVVEELAVKNVTSETDFQWLSQLRYYWEESVMVRITNATVPYAYEYLGNTPRLVITPLTDRCYRTLIGAYHLHLNGAPEGPAGTGKTETTKDLAKAIAVQCVVFNCSDGLDSIAMGKFFKGLASSGAWACFDEFNRIEIEVLSVVAQQILCIVQAVRGKMVKFMFEGTELVLNPSCYVCITMNPGYAGRSELPDNLKVLFRTVAMMVPDYALIGEISLYSFGFVNARQLSVKIVTTYRLCSEQLSSQSHYDYGMRAVKTVLSAAGNLKLKYPDESEDILLLRSIIDVNLPKFLNHDVPLFEGIISDLFIGIKVPTPDYDIFLQAVKEICQQRVLQPRPSFMTKIIQTYEMMIVRHGFMLVGDPFSGKSSTLKVLADTLTMLNSQGEPEEKTYFRTLNPKSVTMGQLYGQFDAVSHEWSDGIIATTFRKFAMTDNEDRKWIIFDGPVDAVWIENMNTVLDDNKKLCLNSGEVIAMTNAMSMIFEVMDLTQASPATVSRCGMIYMESSTLGWRPLVESWLETAPEIYKQDQEHNLMGMFDWLGPPCLYFIRKQCIQLSNAGVSNSVKATIQLVDMLLKEACELNNDRQNLTIWIQAAFLFAGTWGFGGALDSHSRELFDVFYKDIWKGNNPEHLMPEDMDPVEVLIPMEGLLHDNYYYFKGKGTWKYWPDLLRNFKIEEAPNVQHTLIPTVDTAKYLHVLEMHIHHKVPLLLVGPTGTGKSFYIQKMLMSNLSFDEYSPAFISFTASTSANLTQELIISKLQKRGKGTYGPAAGKVSVIFVDDMNMPAKEVYGAQPPIELLRQFFDHGHWYDLKDTSKIYIEDLLLLTAMAPPGGSRQDVYARFLRHFNIYSINTFSEESLTKIFTTILFIGLKRNGFPSDIMPVVVNVVSSTMFIYHSAMANLKPTPAKSHYNFNMRDFSRVINGHLLLKKESAESKKTFVKLWVHEVMRVFYDRLIDDSDREWLITHIQLGVKDHFKENFNSSLDNLLPPGRKSITEEDLSRLMFSTALDVDAEDDRKYEELTVEELLSAALLVLDEYNATHKQKMTIVLFRFALEHLSRVIRILSVPGGCALLVGVGGSGRQSLTRLAAAVCNYTVFQPEITKNYGFNEWREDLKYVMKESGGRNKPTVFLFTEGQIKAEYFLQDIDCMLNSGEVPNIFPIDEVQEILELVRLAAQGGNRHLDINPLAVYSFFINRNKQNLHIILCFSPIGSAFRTRLRLYPSLINCCTIDWFEAWPEDALEKVAMRYLTDVNIPNDVKDAAVIACKYFHVCARKMSEEFYNVTGRKTYITSASYLNLIRLYTDLITLKQKEIMTAKMRYVGGVEQLVFAAGQVAIMQAELEALQPKLKIAANETMQMMKIIEQDTKTVEATKTLLQEDERVAKIQAEAATELKDECERDLRVAEPALDEAVKALDILKPADITLVKSMKNPPVAVKLVMAAVCVMMDIKADRVPDPSKPGHFMMDFWGPSKRLLGDINLIDKLKEYDKDNISVSIMNTIRSIYKINPIFNPSIVAKASSAAKGLCKWILALEKYDVIVKIVAPKKAKLKQAQDEYEATMAILEEKLAQVRELEEKLAELNKKLAAAQETKQRLQDEVELCSSKLIQAEKLIGGLGGEKSRWMQAAEVLQTSYDSLAGDVLISSGIMAYLAPFTSANRLALIEDWKGLCKKLKIPASANYNMVTVLGSDIKIQNWNICGLPRDAFSTENAIILDSSNRWSLLIDPQGQANKWIKAMEKYNDLEVVKLVDPTYMKKLEICLEYGKPALVEDVGEDLDPPLDPILLKQTFKQGASEYISLGDNVIDYNPRFRLYITSKLRNPHYLPEVINKITLINFALTVEGLEDQLLGIVVAKERPDLEEKRQMLIVESANNRKTLKEVEDSILFTLSSSTGNILEDKTAIDILDSSKALSVDIQLKEVATKETAEVIETFRLGYTPIAQHSAILYYCISDLPNVDPMYQYSLTWFINIYIMSIDTAKHSKVLKTRLEFLRSTFTYNLYQNVCRSLFEKDKTLFSFVLCSSIMIAEDRLHEAELTFLLTGGVGLENPHPNPASQWLSDKSWDEVCRLADVKYFKDFGESFVKNLEDWKQFYDLTEPQESPLPSPWEDQLSSFQKLIIIRVLRPDKVVPLIIKFVKLEMGIEFVQPPPFDIAKSYGDSNCLSPLIFILSPGIDPIAGLIQYSQKMGFGAKFQSISLGQNQGPIAAGLIKNAQVEGEWVCLQNCHLAASWMPQLDHICENLDLSNTTLDFRLWLTSYPTDKFPSSILQNGVKMTNEPPTGLQMNLLRSYSSEPVNDPDFFNGCPGKQKFFCKLLYGISFFHAVVQERRKFGPIGWNIPYEFNESDYQISIQQLQMFINESEEVPFAAILYMVGECNYGGRVTDDWDRRTLNTILKDFCKIEVIETPNYLFCDASTKYAVPFLCEFEYFIKAIEDLPTLPTPEVFGLHMNAGITRDLQTTQKMFDTMLVLQGGIKIEGGNTDEVLFTIAHDILSKLPPLFDLEEASEKYPVLYNESMNTVLVQEMERFNKLLERIRSTLQNLQKAIKGVLEMSPQLESVSNSLMISRFPAAWAQVSYPSLKPLGSYVSDFLERVAVLRDWFNEGKPNTFWLSGFFFTQAFLTGAMQNYARRYAIPIDQLTYDFEILKQESTAKMNKPAPDGVYVYGLFVEGARWDRSLSLLEEQYPKVLYDTMPMIWFKPQIKNKLVVGSRYNCPLYKTSDRRGILSTTGHSTNYVLPILLDTNKLVSHWIKRGVALLCQLND